MDELPDAIRCNEDLERLQSLLSNIDVVPRIFRHLIELEDASNPEFAEPISELLTASVKEYTSRLTPLYHAVPWSDSVVEISEFKEIYAKTVELSGGFKNLTAKNMATVLQIYPASLMVFRLIVGYTWSELSDILLLKSEQSVSPSKLQQIERARSPEDIPGKFNPNIFITIARVIFGIVEGSVMALPENLSPEDFRSRQFKIDTIAGWDSVNRCASGTVDYSDVLYERYTGRPFAYIRDALSEKKGNLLEDALEGILREDGIPYDRIDDNLAPGFEQAPDYLLPNRNAPRIAIEAKLAEDGGTARDKASRIERLRRPCEARGIVLMALIDGKGFRRFNDVLLPTVRNTKGHTYTLETISEILTVSEVRSLRLDR